MLIELAAWQALIDHLGALPNLERGSHAMSLLDQDLAAVAAKGSTIPLIPRRPPSESP